MMDSSTGMTSHRGFRKVQISIGGMSVSEREREREREKESDYLHSVTDERTG